MLGLDVMTLELRMQDRGGSAVISLLVSWQYKEMLQKMFWQKLH